MWTIARYFIEEPLVAVSEQSVNVRCAAISVPQRYPSLVHLRRNEFKRTRSPAEQKLDNAGAVYVSLASTVARNMSCRDCCGRPRALSTRSAYSSLEHDANSSVTWSLAVSQSFVMTPSVISCVTCFISRHSDGSSSDFPRTPQARKMICLDLAFFSSRLLSLAHACIWSSSLTQVWLLAAVPSPYDL